MASGRGNPQRQWKKPLFDEMTSQVCQPPMQEGRLSASQLRTRKRQDRRNRKRLDQEWKKLDLEFQQGPPHFSQGQRRAEHSLGPCQSMGRQFAPWDGKPVKILQRKKPEDPNDAQSPLQVDQGERRLKELLESVQSEERQCAAQGAKAKTFFQGKKEGSRKDVQSFEIDLPPFAIPKNMAGYRGDTQPLQTDLPSFAFDLDLDEVVPEPSEEVLARLEAAYHKFAYEKELVGEEPYLTPEIRRMMQEMNVKLDLEDKKEEAETKERKSSRNYKGFFIALGTEQLRARTGPWQRRRHHQLTAEGAEELWGNVERGLLEERRVSSEFHEKMKKIERRFSDWKI